MSFLLIRVMMTIVYTDVMIDFRTPNLIGCSRRQLYIIKKIKMIRSERKFVKPSSINPAQKVPNQQYISATYLVPRL